ncbi:hypothetical protein AKJ16_DCAP00870, partial [Drosera capensis]
PDKDRVAGAHFTDRSKLRSCCIKRLSHTTTFHSSCRGDDDGIIGYPFRMLLFWRAGVPIDVATAFERSFIFGIVSALEHITVQY